MTRFLEQLELHVIEPIARFSKWKDNQIIALSKQLFTLKKNKQLAEFWNKLFEFEAFLSISTGIREQGFNFPTFQNQGISLHGFYHPLLTRPVKNNFKTEKTVVLLNGPNMSGKSTMLKAIGICIYLGHLGVGIPAGKAILPFMHRFSVAINRNDDLQKGYSHFMTELNNLKQVVNQAVAGYHCFAVFDELFSGTNEEDAFEILKTTVHGLGKFTNSLFFISTHIQKFKEVKHQWIANYHVECTVVKEQPHFTYRIKEGWSDIKVGEILFNREGLNNMLR
jgi:DNA mismatch repair protein MutS